MGLIFRINHTLRMNKQEKQIDVSIIIVNYNTSKLINDSIESIFRLTEGIEYEIIVVDNNTEDLSMTITAADDGRVKFIQLPENVGFGRANNAGFEIAKGRNLFCLNPDTVLLNNAIKILSDYLDAHPECGACGGNLYDEEMRPALSFRRILPGIRWELNELSHLWLEKLMFGKNSRFNSGHKPISVGYISGADLMIRADVCQKLDGYSPEFFMYYEETDLCKRIHEIGYRIYSVPQAEIQHLEGGSFDSSKPINYARLERSEIGRQTYMARNNSKLDRYISNGIYKAFLFSRWKLKSSESHKVRLRILSNL